MKPRLMTAVAIIFAAALTRLVPHPWNFAPITAIALFGGAHLSKRMGFLIPAAAMLISDLILGFHATLPYVYASFFLIVLLGQWIQKDQTVSRIGGAAAVSSLLFFLLTNLGVWISGSIYPLTGEGLVACFVAAIPFFHQTLLGDLLYTATLFGGFALATRWVPRLRETAVA